MSSLSYRLIFGFTLALLWFLAIYWVYHPLFAPVFSAMIAISAMLGLREFYALSRKKGCRPVEMGGLVACLVLIFSNYLATRMPLWAPLPFMVMLCTVFALFLHFFNEEDSPIIDISVSIFGLVYVVWPMALLIPLVFGQNVGGAEHGRWWLLYLLAVTKVTDMGAFFVGGSWGRIKLAVHLSPGKTREGAVGGIIFAVMTSFLFYLAGIQEVFPGLFQLGLVESLVLGLSIGIVGQVGDLAESLLKRDAGVKDSGNIPGLGGVLDIVDSILFTSPLLYIFLMLRDSGGLG